VPFIVPGVSLHRELRILIESGLTPYEALRAATVAPATFLGKKEEFGTIAPGRRADLLLVDSNPLLDIDNLKLMRGVMVRGQWLTEEQLQQMLGALITSR
jgi:imidazolonepropionase-like amidohydrolase